MALKDIFIGYLEFEIIVNCRKLFILQMRTLYRIPLLAISTLLLCKNKKFIFVLIWSYLLVKCLKKLEEANDYVRSPPPIQSTEQPASRPPRFVESSINKHDDR
jgi:hypothetical protein